MAKSSNQKLKLLYLLKMLNEKTDENNTMTINDMIAELERYGITAERKSIYDDLEALRHYGLDIAMQKTKTTDYYVASRVFELPELKLLVDAVQCSKFVTHKKSNELIKKIESLASRKQAQSLQRQVFVTNRVKTINESIYYNIDSLHLAIAQNKKVTFKYFDYDIRKEKVFRKNGGKYTVSPYGLSWDDENYYLITFSTKYDGFTHYRVDRMTNIDLIEEERDPLSDKEHFDIAEYTKKVFNMFNGDEVMVNLQLDNSLVNAVVDRFGKDIQIGKVDDDNFNIWIKVAVSSTFFAWISQFGNKVKILSPESVVEKYISHLKEISSLY
ncbi:MAG: WYL domain-containing protein [Firmicutes bacterium HGW-Firmicutes-2]|jgi:predicted DNA-binding transcriptional regulator YafY|nr:MAG: WYL domain-containing protein [Firmicutes bacterium HGW-Firmicutes-2]